MAIIKSGEVFTRKFGDREEPAIDVVLGDLPVQFSILAPFRRLDSTHKYKLTLTLNKEQFGEVQKEMAHAIEQLNEEGKYGATKKEIQECIAQAINESTKEPGTFRFLGSRKMGFTSRETGEMQAYSIHCYDGEVTEDTYLEGGVKLGAGSVVKSKYQVSIWRDQQKKLRLNINPIEVVVVNKVEPPERARLGYDGVDSYDY